MASPQVLPNSAASSKKQELLEAGKRRLEEFRKKKAAERGKKAASTSHNHTSNTSVHEKQPLETEHARLTELDGVGPSDGIGGSIIEPSAAVNNNDKSSSILSQSSDQGSWSGRDTGLLHPKNNHNVVSADPGKTHANGEEFKRYGGSSFSALNDFNQKNERDPVNNVYGEYGSFHNRVLYGSKSDQSIPLLLQDRDFGSTTSQSNFHGMDESYSNKSSNFLKDYTVRNHDSSLVTVSNISPQNSLDTVMQTTPTNSSILDIGYINGPLYKEYRQLANDLRASNEFGYNSHGSAGSTDSMISELRGGMLSTPGSGFPSLHGTAMWKSFSTDSDTINTSTNVPAYSVAPESNPRRSRPSFLDSINVPRPTSGTPFKHVEPGIYSSVSNSVSKGMDMSQSTLFYKSSTDIETTAPFSNYITPNVPSALENSVNSSFPFSNSHANFRTTANENNLEKNLEFRLPKQNEDFATLEQHIEDLTQEKFSLQRAVEASRALAESLAAENSSLTDSYNQQRSVVNKLQSDMEMLQQEIKAHLVELESIKVEYANAQLECNTADERAKLLASEVIGLEEKALRLRSSELKLEKQMENSQAEISSYKKKMSSLEKERQDLQSTFDALQEEKKLLQSKLRKASGSGKSIDMMKSPTNKKDVSTSTEDIENRDAVATNSNQEMHDSDAGLDGDASGFPLLNENGHPAIGVSFVDIPPDQLKIIENINALISELALEKEELMQALMFESSQCSRLKESNKELSQKLEVQTQRLELLTTKSMANENIPAKQPDSHTLNDNAPYADEGDEVVERVLGWIMKLFPGGPSRRRTSKLL
ncbi:BLISTER protein [Quillaja saponaria]|uniref:BLISTER protein n=1 Tax=Quillaja saponaria TaxID=32244 RepID=A0AAD7QEF0_QUISA|nr:BLISTER protein [Quillaja saponaria]